MKTNPRKLKVYINRLKKPYLIPVNSCADDMRNHADKNIYKINHVRIIIEMLSNNPDEIEKEDFPIEVEKYERKILRGYVRTRRLRRMRKTIEEMRKLGKSFIEVLVNELRAQEPYLN
ncbi:MAG: hypothetical protein QW040_02070 [Candidatus Aenigmatarchaeota archaeon]